MVSFGRIPSDRMALLKIANQSSSTFVFLADSPAG
jgi:hypothetical protein